MNTRNGGVAMTVMTASVAMLLLFGTPRPLRAEGPIITNGDFSLGMEGWTYKTTVIRNGYVTDEPPSKEKRWQIVEDASGNKAVEITMDPNESVSLTHEFRITKKQTGFTVDLRAKASADFTARNGPRLNVGFTAPDLTPRDRHHFRAFLLKPEDGWQQLSTDFYPQTKETTIKLSISLGVGTGKVLIDDIIVRGAPPRMSPPLFTR